MITILFQVLSSPGALKIALTMWLAALPGVPDRAGRPIYRPQRVPEYIAIASMHADDPQRYAAMLDVLGSRESGWEPAAVGDSGKSCGTFQTPCGSTPMPDGWKEDDLRTRRSKITAAIREGQLHRAMHILDYSIANCPEHPLWMYASGACSKSNTADKYEKLVDAELAVPMPGDDTTASSQ